MSHPPFSFTTSAISRHSTSRLPVPVLYAPPPELRRELPEAPPRVPEPRRLGRLPPPPVPELLAVGSTSAPAAAHPRRLSPTAASPPAASPPAVARVRSDPRGPADPCPPAASRRPSPDPPPPAGPTPPPSAPPSDPAAPAAPAASPQWWSGPQGVVDGSVGRIDISELLKAAAAAAAAEVAAEANGEEGEAVKRAPAPVEEAKPVVVSRVLVRTSSWTKKEEAVPSSADLKLSTNLYDAMDAIVGSTTSMAMLAMATTEANSFL